MSKKAVETIVRRSISSLSETMQALGGEALHTTEDEISEMVEVMLPHFNLTEQEFAECEAFLNSELFAKYSSTVKSMGGALTKHAQEMVKGKTVH